MFEYFKALHIIFVVTWFSGLFYIVRLFVYHAEAFNEENEVVKKRLIDQYSLMEKRLWYGITWPSAVLSMVFGLSLLHYYFPLGQHPWLIVKLIFVFLLFLYHLSCGYYLKKLKNSVIRPEFFRMWNEVATLFLVAIVFLVVLRSALDMLYGLIGLSILMIVLFAAIKIYKKKRLKSS